MLRERLESSGLIGSLEQYEQMDLYDAMSDPIVNTIAGVTVAVSGGYSIKSWRFQKRIETIGRMQGLLIGVALFLR